MKVAVYTCITGNYDDLRAAATQVGTDVDFYCFSDRARNVATPWRQVAIESCPYAGAAANRWVKMLPHRQPVLASYDASLYVDGSIELVSDISPFLRECFARVEDVQMYQHPFRDCAYDEALACARFGLDSVLTIGRQMRAMHACGFPAKHGLFEAGIIFRRHRENVAHGMEAWWHAYRQGARRDQLSLPYVAWRESLPIGNLGVSDARHTHTYFKLHPHKASSVPLRTSIRSRVNRFLLATMGARKLLGA